MIAKLPRTSPLGRALLAAGAASFLACAHAEGKAAASASEPEAMLVTGSHMPRPVSRTGLPVTDFSVKIYGRSDLERTGLADPAAALRKAEPAAQ